MTRRIYLLFILILILILICICICVISQRRQPTTKHQRMPDAASMTAAVGCHSNNGNCSSTKERLQWSVGPRPATASVVFCRLIVDF